MIKSVKNHHQVTQTNNCFLKLESLHFLAMNPPSSLTSNASLLKRINSSHQHTRLKTLPDNHHTGKPAIIFQGPIYNHQWAQAFTQLRIKSCALYPPYMSSKSRISVAIFRNFRRRQKEHVVVVAIYLDRSTELLHGIICGPAVAHLRIEGMTQCAYSGQHVPRGLWPPVHTGRF